MKISMFFKICRMIKIFILGIFLFSISINGMGKNQNTVNQLVTTVRENKGKILASGAIAITTVWLCYQYRKPIKKYLKPYVRYFRNYFSLSSSINAPTYNNNSNESAAQSSDDQVYDPVLKVTEEEKLLIPDAEFPHPKSWIFTYHENLPIPIGQKKITINNMSGGGIKVYTDEKSDFELLIIKRGPDPDVFKKIKPSFNKDSQKFKVETKFTANSLFNFILKLPNTPHELTKLILKTDRGGSIVAENITVTGNFIASSKYGSISVKKISINYPLTFSCSISKDDTKLTAAKLNAKMHLQTTKGKITSGFKLDKKSGSEKNFRAEIGEIGTDIPKHTLDISADENISLIKQQMKK